MVFVKPAVRKSLLAKMLGEILDTRVMVKQAMKGYRNDKVWQWPYTKLEHKADEVAVSHPATERPSAGSQAYGGERICCAVQRAVLIG